MKEKRVGLPRFLVLIMGVLLFAVLILAIFRLDHARQEVGREQLEQVLHRTAAACYAAEGFYPPDLNYMMIHYGIHYDHETYTVHYRRFASNLMPEITVLDRNS